MTEQEQDCLAEMTALVMEGLITEIESAAVMKNGIPRLETIDDDAAHYCAIMLAAIRRTTALIGIPDASASPYRDDGSWPAWLVDLIKRRREL